MIAHRFVPLIASLCFASAAAAEPPTLIAEAITNVMARAEPDKRWSFTRTQTNGEGSFALRYDPSRTPESAWILLAPTEPEALGGRLRGVLEDAQDEETADLKAHRAPSEILAPLADAFAQGFGEDITIASEDAERAVYVFEPILDDDDELADVREHLRQELTVEKAERVVTAIRYVAIESFKPGPVARFNTMDLTMRFGEVEPGGPIALLEVDTQATGSALFRRFDESWLITNSDFARVEAPEAATE